MIKKMLMLTLVAFMAISFIPDPPKAEASITITGTMIVAVAAVLTAAGITALSAIDLEKIAKGFLDYAKGSFELFSYIAEVALTGKIKVTPLLAQYVDTYKNQVVDGAGYEFYDDFVEGVFASGQYIYEDVAYQSIFGQMVEEQYFSFDLTDYQLSMSSVNTASSYRLKFRHYTKNGVYIEDRTWWVFHDEFYRVYAGSNSYHVNSLLGFRFERFKGFYYDNVLKNWYVRTDNGNYALPFNGEFVSAEIKPHSYGGTFRIFGNVSTSYTTVSGADYQVDVKGKINDYVGKTLSTGEVKTGGITVPVTGVESYVGATAESIPVTAVDVGGVDVSAENIPIDLTPVSPGEIDWMPLIRFGNNFKSKFPFSIPWDIKNAVESLSAPAVVPRWEIPLDSWKLGANTLVIDFEQFDTLAKITRWGILFLFVFGLAMLSRYLIGA